MSQIVYPMIRLLVAGLAWNPTSFLLACRGKTQRIEITTKATAEKNSYSTPPISRNISAQYIGKIAPVISQKVIIIHHLCRMSKVQAWCALSGFVFL